MTKVFPASLNILTPTLDSKVLRWAWSEGLFEEHSELARCRIQKINWFAGYLFPEETPEKMELIMRFFLCLFLLDDLLDNFSGNDSTEFLENLKFRTAQTEIPRLQALSNALIQSHESLGEFGNSEIWKVEWKETWEIYLSGLQWEIYNKEQNLMPILEEYRRYRPAASGVFLAIHLLRTAFHTVSCEAQWLEYDIARLICLSNDLASYDKEFAIGDFHNELIIHKDVLGEKVQSWAVQEIKMIQSRILALAKEIGSKSEMCQRWVDSLFLLVGGCLAWSEETFRYASYVNGNLKSS